MENVLIFIIGVAVGVVGLGLIASLSKPPKRKYVKSGKYRKVKRGRPRKTSPSQPSTL